MAPRKTKPKKVDVVVKAKRHIHKGESYSTGDTIKGVDPATVKVMEQQGVI